MIYFIRCKNLIKEIFQKNVRCNHISRIIINCKFSLLRLINSQQNVGLKLKLNNSNKERKKEILVAFRLTRSLNKLGQALQLFLIVIRFRKIIDKFQSRLQYAFARKKNTRNKRLKFLSYMYIYFSISRACFKSFSNNASEFEVKIKPVQNRARHFFSSGSKIIAGVGRYISLRILSPQFVNASLKHGSTGNRINIHR